MKKTLILLRHAKAEPGEDDHARPLAERGRQEAVRMGEYLRAQNISPQRVLCSTAVRTRETYEWAESLLLPTANCQLLTSLYNASESQLLQIIATQPEAVSSLMLIAHNPGLHQLTLRLSGHDARAADFPPCSLAVVELGGIEWRDIKTARGALEIFVTPKTL